MSSGKKIQRQREWERFTQDFYEVFGLFVTMTHQDRVASLLLLGLHAFPTWAVVC